MILQLFTRLYSFLCLCLDSMAVCVSAHVHSSAYRNHLGLCVCENSSLQMHLLLVTEALNYFYAVDEYLMAVARTRHV